MVRILFVCHGNICRSPMAEFVMKDIVRRLGYEGFEIESCATSTEEIGNDTHYGTRNVLEKHGVPYRRRSARQMTCADYDRFDYIVAMDEMNLRNMRRFVNGDPEKKVSLLMEHAGERRGVVDPWYSGNFDVTFEDVLRGCSGLLDEILSGRSL